MKYIRKRNIALNVGGQMDRPVLVRCNHCENITTVNYKEKKYKGGLTETYFKCVICNHHYTCFVVDKKVKQMQTKAKNLRRVMQFKDVRDELQSLQEKINARMNELKQELVNSGT
jgi:phage terminase large subunit GpA-like protein